MRKTLCLLAAILLSGLCVSAQSFSWTFPTKKSLKMESERRQCEIDSLKRCLDSLLKEKLLTECDTLAAEPEDTEEIADAKTYSAEEADSLVNIWYERQRRDFISCSAPSPEDLDSVAFSSKVSDEVMIERLKKTNPYFTLPFNQTVKNYMVLYSEKMASYMPRILGLSTYYFPLFEEILCKYGLPLELKYMAVIESRFNPVAESRVGARGMWQFMYRTAKSYGLRISSFVDERFDVEKAADAAARYMRDSYELFGDWNLVICSYNCGTGNVLKAIRRSGSRNFWDLYPYLPRETRGYVPAFVGAMYAMTYWREYNMVPEEVGLPALTDTFEIKRNLHFKQIEELVGVPMDMLKLLNPQYIHEIIPGNDGTYILRLPQDKSGAFISAEADSLYTHKADKLLSEQVLKNIQANGGGNRIAHRVRSGECLSTIARKYGCKVSQLRNWNKLRSDNLRVGQTLYIYR